MNRSRRIYVTWRRLIVWPLGGILRRFLVGLVGLRSNSDIDNTVAQAITLQFKLIQYFLRRYINTFRKQLT
jgi:hypothetical protein